MLLLAATCFSQNPVLRTIEGKNILGKHVKFNPLTIKQAAKSFGAKSLGDTIFSFPWSEGFEDSISGYTFSITTTTDSTGGLERARKSPIQERR